MCKDSEIILIFHQSANCITEEISLNPSEGLSVMKISI
ncbi:MAG: hypothetical protein PETM_00858 [Petrimonas sp.]